MAEPTTGDDGSLAEIEARVLAVVRQLAGETGGERAGRAATVRASFERDLGLGSLERVELLSRLEAAFHRPLEDKHLEIDTVGEMARALLAAGSPVDEPRRAAAPSADPRAAATLFTGARTLHESLFLRARADPERPAIHLREDDGGERLITYDGLWRAAAALAGGLRDEGVKRGDTVAVMLPTGHDFLRSFPGILAAGAVPVPIYPPARIDRLDEYAMRQSAILADAGVKLLITVARALPVAAVLRRAVPTLRRVVTADELGARGAPVDAAEGSGSDPAFVQYTSGSTGSPKGVLLTHDNLLANIRAIAAGVGLQPTDVGASWLPLYHDMGLIGSLLFCLHHGLPLALQSPLSFLARPERWLWAIHERRATLSAAPNFAYELCVRRISDASIEGLDLSSWRCALNGAEPVSAATLERFALRFAPYGFRREALLPVYGLAENAVALCFPPVGRGVRVDRIDRAQFEREARAVPAAGPDAPALSFVSVGPALPEHEVRIVDDRGDPVPDRALGRLVFRGPSMTAGYFKNVGATDAIRAREGFLDSGDLAYRAEGEFYVAARRKDLIIKAGRNLVPQEIEEAAAAVRGVRRGGVVAFSVVSAELGTERLLVAAETRARTPAERDRIEAAITARVADAVGLPPDEVVLVPPGAVPRTSSGKVRRNATKELFLAGELGQAARTSAGQKLRLAVGAAAAALRPWRRRLLQALYDVWLVCVLPIVAAPLWVAVFFAPNRRFAFACGRLTVRLGLRLAFCRLTAEGLEHLPREGPYLLAANHASYVDVPALMALLPLDFLFAAKVEALRYPIVGTYLERCRHLTVDRTDVHQSVTDFASVSKALKIGERVLLFPEATFTDDDGMRPFRMGAFKAAIEMSVPVVPLALAGSRRILRGDSLRPWPGRIHLWVGAPLAASGSDWRAMVALRDQVASAIAAHCGEPRLDVVAGYRPPPR